MIMSELITNLESNDPKLVEETKQKFHEQFNITKESWLVNGLYEMYLNTNSTRLMEVLINVKEPHHTYLFDKICESIKSSKDHVKIQGLAILGHIVTNQPAWVYKITSHSLMKELLKLLKTETDVVTLLSALMALIVLLPLIPSLMAEYLKDVFEIFCRFASWNCHATGKMLEEQMAHLQLALYALFLRLYGMYPCNFLSYLRDQYRNKTLFPIFCHTIQPMLDTVRMNPHLVTTSTTTETSIERWRKMGSHDVLVECERYSLDLPERCTHEQCPVNSRPRSVGVYPENSSQMHTLRLFPGNLALGDGDFFSPSMLLHCPTPPIAEKSYPTPIPFAQATVVQTPISSVSQMSQDSSSPPEAAIEATPETTPVRDTRTNVRMPPASSAIARAHTFVTRGKPLGSGGQSTPSTSQPSSPMRKEVSPFNFQEIPKQSTAFGNPRRLQMMMQDRSQMSEPLPESSGRSRQFATIPTSPSRALVSEVPVPGSPVLTQRLDSPVTQEDEEVSQIVRQGETVQHSELRHCDSVLHEAEGSRGNEEDAENCEQEHGSPCTEGGLHMPNSKSINDLTMRLRRLRYHSQCADDNERYGRSAGSSPGNAVSFPNNMSVRRANSCPEMKKCPIAPGKDNRTNRTLLETDEDGNTVGQDAGSNRRDKKKVAKRVMLKTTETQTDIFWPMPYDHLFLSIFPSLDSSGDTASSLMKKPDMPQCANTYELPDKYIDTATFSNDKDSVHQLKYQMELLRLQLHFEKHRRDMHAMKNRRLLADSKNTRALEEHKEALMDNVSMKQKDINDLTNQVEALRTELHHKEMEAMVNTKSWDQNYKLVDSECKRLTDKNDNYQKEIEKLRKQNDTLDAECQEAESMLLEALAEVKVTKEQADAGERGRIELEQVNKEMVLLGDLQLKTQERLNDALLSKRGDVEQKRLVDNLRHDVQVLTQQLDSKTRNLDACKSRVAELEGVIQKHDEVCSLQKRQLNDVKEECHEQLKAVESKYQTQLNINRCLEEKIVDLWQRIEFLTKKVTSPDISSAHEVNVTDRTSITQGLSSQSSPLSVSLASEANAPSTVSEVKNIQKIVGQKDNNE